MFEWKIIVRISTSTAFQRSLKHLLSTAFCVKRINSFIKSPQSGKFDFKINFRKGYRPFSSHRRAQSALKHPCENALYPNWPKNENAPTQRYINPLSYRKKIGPLAHRSQPSFPLAQQTRLFALATRANSIYYRTKSDKSRGYWVNFSKSSPLSHTRPGRRMRTTGRDTLRVGRLSMIPISQCRPFTIKYPQRNPWKGHGALYIARICQSKGEKKRGVDARS